MRKTTLLLTLLALAGTAAAGEAALPQAPPGLTVQFACGDCQPVQGAEAFKDVLAELSVRTAPAPAAPAPSPE